MTYKFRAIFQQIGMLKRRFSDSVMEKGYSGPFLTALKIIKNLFWQDITLFKFHIIFEHAYRLKKPLPGIIFREARPEDYDELIKHSIHFSEGEMFRRFLENQKCVIGVKNGEIILYCWIATDKVWMPFMGNYMFLPADTAYFYNTFILRKHRGNRIFLAFTSYIREFCLENNIPYGLSLVYPDSGIPIRAYTRMVGADKIYLLSFKRKFGIRSHTEKEISVREAVNISKKV